MSGLSGVVDVVIPVYNGATTIATALDSVLAQTDVRIGEIIIVDDGSTDETVAVVTAMNAPVIRLLSQKNAGVAAARNTGIAQSRSDWIAFLDADDAWSAEKLGVQLDLATRFNVPFVCSAAGTNGTRTDGYIDFFSLWRGNFIATSSVLIRRDIAQRLAPLFNREMTFAEDYAAWFRVLLIHPGYFTNRQLTRYVISEKPHYRFVKILRNFASFQSQSLRLICVGQMPIGRRLAAAFAIVSGCVLSLASIIIRFLLSHLRTR